METEGEVRRGVNLMPLTHLTKLLIEKGLITEAELMEKLSAERAGYQGVLEKVI